MSNDVFVKGSEVGGDDNVFESAKQKLLSRFLERFSHGTLIVELPSGQRITRRGAEEGPEGIIKLNSWRAIRRLATAGDIGFAEGYMEGDWTTPNLLNLLFWTCINEKALSAAWTGSLIERIVDRLRHMRRSNTKRGSRRNISAHYDLGNDFYAAWLDAGMNYSSAIYSGQGQSIEAAQTAKLDRAIELLEVSDGMDVLEIGCGWGALAERLLDNKTCKLTGLTLSREQLIYAQKRLAKHRNGGDAAFLMRDYRDMRGRFDRVVSIEMFEAVGEKYWPDYFANVRDRLAPDGVAVLQVITIEESRFLDYRNRPDFIQKYIFPGGMLPTVDRLSSLASDAGLAIDYVQHFGQSYAKTLAVWREKFLRAWPTLAQNRLGAERFKNMWEYYLGYCEVGFTTGALDVGLYKLKIA